MRAVIAASGVIVVASVMATVAVASPSSVAIKGEITSLGVRHVGVGRISCAIPTRLENAAARFVVGDYVTLSCNGKTLVSIRRWTPPAPKLAQSGAGNTTTSTSTSTQSAVGGYSVGRVGSPSDSSTASGSITALSGSSISVGAQQCSIPSSLSVAVSQVAKIGDSVTMICSSGSGDLWRISTPGWS